ncbi:Uncharacterised protein [Mycobacteroides abscessus subsp. abscessus]|nr:Uncharacterised protein [Mycobacteroides abscessus subsp. abscessus]
MPAKSSAVPLAAVAMVICRTPSAVVMYSVCSVEVMLGTLAAGRTMRTWGRAVNASGPRSPEAVKPCLR